MKQNRETASKKRTIYIVTEREYNRHEDEGCGPRRIGVFGSEAKAIRAFCHTVNDQLLREAKNAAREALRDDPLMKRFNHPFAKSEIAQANDWQNRWFNQFSCGWKKSPAEVRYRADNGELWHITTRLYATVEIDVRRPAVKATAVRQALEDEREAHDFNLGYCIGPDSVSLFFAYDDNEERGVTIEQVVVE